MRISIAVLVALAASTPVFCAAQVGDRPTIARIDSERPAPHSPLASEVLGRPLTVLDYVLSGITRELKPDSNWYFWARRGLWTAGNGRDLPEKATPATHYDAASDRIAVGYELVVRKLLAPPRDVCTTLIRMYLEPALALGSGYVGVRGMASARLEEYLPTGPSGSLNEKQRLTLASDLQSRLTLWIKIDDMDNRNTWFCSRDALKDSLTIVRR